MPKKFHLINAKLKFQLIYECDLCKKQKNGDTITSSYIGYSAEQLKDFLDNHHIPPTSMPEGWSYNGVYNCGCAK